jgi:mediator of RNA polymerase II transcription subunit 25
MNIKRLLNIAQEADKIGDYVIADRVDNFLKTAQGQYSVYPNQAAYSRTPQQSQQMLAAQQNQNNPANQQMPQMQQMNQQMPQMQQMNQQMPQMPQMNQQMPQMPQQGGVYNPGMAPGATYYTPGVVNVAQPQMTEEQKAFAKLRGLKGQVQQADQVVQNQRLQPKRYQIYQTYQQPIYQGTNTQDQYNFNPNAPTNMNLYGTGYASMAMQPQQTQPPYNPQQPQQQMQPQQQYPYNQRRNPNS